MRILDVSRWCVTAAVLAVVLPSGPCSQTEDNAVVVPVSGGSEKPVVWQVFGFVDMESA
jgi:hypothetical protein